MCFSTSKRNIRNPVLKVLFILHLMLRSPTISAGKHNQTCGSHQHSKTRFLIFSLEFELATNLQKLWKALYWIDLDSFVTATVKWQIAHLHLRRISQSKFSSHSRSRSLRELCLKTLNLDILPDWWRNYSEGKSKPRLGAGRATTSIPYQNRL